MREVLATGGVVGPSSTIVTVAGSGAAGSGGDGGLATAAQFNNPAGVAVDRAGNLYIADYYNNRVREVLAVGGSVGPSSTIITVAGGGSPPSGVGDGGPAAQASLSSPAGVALDAAGNLYVADRYHYRVREVLATGGGVGPTSPITTVAGTGTQGYNGDGIPAISASLMAPTGVAVDAAGNLYIADYNNGRVRGVLATGGSIGATSLITTVAGTGNIGYNGDNIPAATAQLNNPFGLATDGAGNLYIVDTYGQRVREVGGVGPRTFATTVVTPIVTTSYNGDGEPTRQTDANGNTTTSLYDPLGRMVTQTNPVSGTSIMTYTATELTQQRDAQGNVTSYGYDPAGRQTLVSNPVTGPVQSGYDAAGNTVAMTTTDATAGGAVTTLESMGYDSFNRVTSDTVVTDTSRGLAGPTLTTLTAYDRDGNVAVVQQPTGDVTVNAYDLADEPSATLLAAAPGQPTTPLSYESYGYDAAGNQATLTDADGRTTTTTYDGDNRVLQSVATSTDDRGTTTITSVPQYDPDGNQTGTTTTTQQPAGTTETHTTGSTYDTNDTLVASGDDGLSTAYGHDPSGDARVETIMSGSALATLGYDAQHRLTSVGESAGGAPPQTATFGYTPNDLLQSEALPGNVQVSLGYDPNSALTNLGANGPNTGATGVTGTTLHSHYGYTYNAAGYMTSMATLSGTDTLAHDASGRLIDEQGPGVVATGHHNQWTYDTNGNLLTATDDTGATNLYTYTVGAGRDPKTINEIQQMGTTGQAANSVVSYGYDSSGDVTSIANGIDPTNPALKGAVNQSVRYDAVGRPVRVTTYDHNIPTTISLSYDAGGERSDYRIQQASTGLNQDYQFGYRGAGELAQVTVLTGGVPLYTDSYLYGPTGEPLELLRQRPGGSLSRYWYVLDGQGSVVALTDANGTVVDRYAYDQWGELTSNDATDERVAQQLRYRGYWYDEKLSWYWLGLRYYDPETARMLQPDPLDLDGTHTYAYAGDDPTDVYDLMGLFNCADASVVVQGRFHRAAFVGVCIALDQALMKEGGINGIVVLYDVFARRLQHAAQPEREQ